MDTTSRNAVEVKFEPFHSSAFTSKEVDWNLNPAKRGVVHKTLVILYFNAHDCFGSHNVEFHDSKLSPFRISSFAVNGLPLKTFDIDLAERSHHFELWAFVEPNVGAV